MWSGSKNPSLHDRFNLVIPFCLDHIRCQYPCIDYAFILLFVEGTSNSFLYSIFWVMNLWNLGEVIYNAVYPLMAPDIIFEPEDETFLPYHGDNEKSNKNGLTDWNSKDPTRLLSLLMELRWVLLRPLQQDERITTSIFIKFGLVALNVCHGWWLSFSHSQGFMAYQRKRIEEVDDDRLKFEISTIFSRKVRVCTAFTCSGIE